MKVHNFFPLSILQDQIKLTDKEKINLIEDIRIMKNNSQNLSESDKININKMINKLSIREITDLISQNSKVPKKEIYNYCLKLKNEK